MKPSPNEPANRGDEPRRGPVPHQWWCGGIKPCACTDDWKHYRLTGEKPTLLRLLEKE